MTINEAVPEVFWRALKELPKKERDGVVTRMTSDKEFMTELLGIIIEQRGKESSDSSEYHADTRGEQDGEFN
ncbi:MAG: hypothetical protein HY808_10495 [Nitrospirae bacterium]|nr:hypothetical protein [Nitrospirota bacterium]